MSAREPPEPDDYIDYYISYLEKRKAPGTVVCNQNALANLREYLQNNNQSADELTADDVELFFEKLKSSGLEENTAGAYAGCVQRFYDYYSTRGTFETNPAAIALENTDFDKHRNPVRREISQVEMGDFLADVTRPQPQAICMLLAKTGIRASELINLDVRDVHLDHPSFKKVEEPRGEISGRPDTIFVPSSIRAGEEYNGEVREKGNKRERDTIIPIDTELKKSLLRHYLTKLESPHQDDDRAQRTGEAEPLFYQRLGYRSKRVIGERATQDGVWRLLKDLGEPRGWYKVGGSAEENVTAHYFRHWFTTQAEQEGIPRPVVKYIRGDVGSDIVDKHYRHFWGDEAKEEYLSNIYYFGIYD
jgi:site-specific recombinase XerD